MVKEAINKDFASIVSIDEPSFKLDDLEASIRKTFFSFSSKVREGNMPWGNVIRFECRSRGIFGPAAIPINEIIPLAFSRILKAEGADVGKFMPSGRNVDKRRLEVSRIFSKILKRGVGITDDRKLTSVLWLILRYHELFPDRLKVLGDEVGAEEIQKQGKRKTPDTLNVEKDVKRRKTTSSTTITTTDSLLPSQNANNNNVTSTFDSSMASLSQQVAPSNLSFLPALPHPTLHSQVISKTVQPSNNVNSSYSILEVRGPHQRTSQQLTSAIQPAQLNYRQHNIHEFGILPSRRSNNILSKTIGSSATSTTTLC